MTRHLLSLTVAAAVVLVAGCSGANGDQTPLAPSTSACWQAMVTQYRTDEATGFTGTFPPGVWAASVPVGFLVAAILTVI